MSIGIVAHDPPVPLNDTDASQQTEGESMRDVHGSSSTEALERPADRHGVGAAPTISRHLSPDGKKRSLMISACDRLAERRGRSRHALGAASCPARTAVSASGRCGSAHTRWRSMSLRLSGQLPPARKRSRHHANHRLTSRCHGVRERSCRRRHQAH